MPCPVPRTGFPLSISVAAGRRESPGRTRHWRRVAPLAGLLAVFGLGVLPCHWVPTAQAQPVQLDHVERGAGAAQGVQEVRVALSEWALTPSRITVPVGRTIRLLAVNAGVLPHALSVEGEGVYAESATVGAGQTAPLELTFSVAGIYDLFCPVNAGQHRDLGQEGTITVLPAALQLPRTGEEDADLPVVSSEDEAGGAGVEAEVETERGAVDEDLS